MHVSCDKDFANNIFVPQLICIPPVPDENGGDHIILGAEKLPETLYITRTCFSFLCIQYI